MGKQLTELAMPTTSSLSALENAAEFIARHIGIGPDDEATMLQAVGAASRDELMASIVPRSIARSQPMAIPAPITEAAALAENARAASGPR